LMSRNLNDLHCRPLFLLNVNVRSLSQNSPMNPALS
jgi:hypothetical protein